MANHRVEATDFNNVLFQKNDVTFGNGGIYTIVIQPNKAIEKVQPLLKNFRVGKKFPK